MSEITYYFTNEESNESISESLIAKAERARRVLDSYNPCSINSEDFDNGIVDLMADLFHLMNQQTGLDIDQVIETARSHYEAEIAESAYETGP